MHLYKIDFLKIKQKLKRTNLNIHRDSDNNQCILETVKQKVSITERLSTALPQQQRGDSP